jgi:O-antigen/teichoic acid export membrane protein
MRDTTLAMIGNAFNLGCFLVAGIIIARYLGTELYGVYIFAVSTGLLIAAISNSILRGLMIIMIRDVAKDQKSAGDYLGSILVINLAATVLTLIILFPAVAMMDLSPLKSNAIFIATLALLIQVFGRIAIAVFRAFERMWYEGGLLILQGLAFLILVGITIFMNGNVLTLLFMLLTSYILMAWIGYLLVNKKFTRPKFRRDVNLWRFLIKGAAPIGIAFFLMSTYDRIGTLALETFRSSSEVGLFGAAFSLTRNFVFIPFVFTGAILPIFSRIAVFSKDELAFAYAKTLKILLIIGLPIAIGITILAKPIILLLYGVDYADASVALQFIAWTIPAFFLSYMAKTALEAMNKQASWTHAILLGVLINLMLNLLLVPRIGVLGASLALLLTDITIVGISFYFVARELFLPYSIMTLGPLKVLVSSAIMAISVVYFRNLNLILLAVLGVVIYVSSLFLLRAFDSQEIALLKDAVQIDKGIRWLGARLGITFDG